MIKGKTFCFTGTLNFASREEAKRLVEEAGGSVPKHVDKTLDYLVVGEKPGPLDHLLTEGKSTRTKVAEKFCIPTLTEQEFLKMFILTGGVDE